MSGATFVDPPPAERGSVLVLALMALLVLMAVGAALVSISTTETGITAYFERGVQAFYGADAALERAIADLAGMSDWDRALDGSAVSTLTDGPATGIRTVAGSAVDLDEETHQLLCGQATACRDADVSAVTTERPWGRNNPRWRPFVWGRLWGEQSAGVYVIVWVADDPGETDGDPLHDGTTADNPGRGRLMLTAQAYGPGGVRRAIQATVARPIIREGVPAGRAIRVVSWREMR